MNLGDGLSLLKGVGPKRLEVLNSEKIFTIQDLLYTFPRRYLDRTLNKSPFLKIGEVVTLMGTVRSSYLAHGRRSRLLVSFVSKNGEKISLVFFQGIRFFQKKLENGLDIVVSGKLENFNGLQIVHPEIEILEDEKSVESAHLGGIIPLYSTTEAMKEENLDSRGIRSLVHQVLESKILIGEILPQKILPKRGLMDRASAFQEIHFPSSEKTLEMAKKRFAYEELFFFHMLMLFKVQKREKWKRVLWPLPESPTAQKVHANLPFALTPDQNKAIETLRDLGKKDVPLAVLLQGDVGSGKTITALLTALRYTDNHIQVAFLAPTEILARQHYATILSFLGNMPFLGIDILLGGEIKKSRLEKLYRLKNGETSLLVGTHSLLQEDVEFSDLGLVIIDEQHKFGVDQRETIRSKGKNPDILAMTATPIPRTLCLTMYGDLNLITIASKPIGRKPIETKWFPSTRRDGVYNSIRKYMKEGRQCYIVYPLVEESEKVDLESCVQSYEVLKKQVFPEFSVGLLHGKMNSADKSRIMGEFQEGKISILVTTTVVEVGVDVPNATILVVEHAERFGLSGLHQLRGRVGRNTIQSFCILLTDDTVSEDARVRLQALVDSNDGFYLAEVDLKLRGPGELLGTRQSGLPDFKVADLEKDAELVKESREDVQTIGVLGELEKSEIRYRFEEGRILFSN